MRQKGSSRYGGYYNNDLRSGVPELNELGVTALVECRETLGRLEQDDPCELDVIHRETRGS